MLLVHKFARNQGPSATIGNAGSQPVSVPALIAGGWCLAVVPVVKTAGTNLAWPRLSRQVPAQQWD